MLQPENEMGTIIAFAQMCGKYGLEIQHIQQAFPDAIIADLQTGQEYRAEFEYCASSFIQHGHNPSKCDLIVCWKNDLEKFHFPVLAVSEWDQSQVRYPTDLERENAALYVENRKLSQEITELRRRMETTITADVINETYAKLFSDEKRQRILTAKKLWPQLGNSAIAVMADASPSYVSEVLAGIEIEPFDIRQLEVITVDGSNHTNGKGG